MKLVSLIICCILLCIASSVQATELEPSNIHINLIGGGTKNITINVTGNEIIYIEHEVLPNDVGINVTYPASVNPLKTSSFNMTIQVAFNIAPNNYTIILKYSYEYKSDDNGGSEDEEEQDIYYPPEIPPVDPPSPIIHPKPDRPNNIYLFRTYDDPMNVWCILFSFVGVIALIIIVLYSLNRKGTKAEKPGEKQK